MTGEDKELQEELKQLMMGEVKMMKAIIKGDGVSKLFPALLCHDMSSLSCFQKPFIRLL